MKTYHWQALAAMVLISFTPVLVKFATKDLSSRAILVLSSVSLLLVYFAYSLCNGENIFTAFRFNRSCLAAYGLGIVLAIALIFYYEALRHGPVAIVTPIWSLQIIGGPLVAWLILGGQVNLNQKFGILLCVAGFWLFTRS